jgi:hypothetical protein
MTKEEKHFVRMCAESGYVHGAILDKDRDKAEKCIRSKYRDPVYLRGMKDIVMERWWKTNV